MFTWICPQCGREVPPAYNECPDCAPRTAPAAAPPQEAAPPAAAPPAYRPAPPAYAPPPAAAPPAYRPAPPAYAPPPPPPPTPAYAPPQAPAYDAPKDSFASSVPTWLMAVLFAFAFLGIIAGIHWLIEGHGQTAPAAAVENPVAKAGANANPFQKFIEVAGVRFAEDPKKKAAVLVKFVLINHSETDIPGLSGNVTLWTVPHKAGEESQGTFGFTTSIGPFEIKEVAAPLVSKLKIYELPDWQNMTAEVQITAPGGAASGDSPAPR
jgi:hypothetical protein